MFKIVKAEIAGAVTKIPLFWRVLAKAECKEKFWELWSKENEDTIRNFYMRSYLNHSEGQNHHWSG